jgi:hypothetical protein
MFLHAYLEELGNGRLGHEEKLLAAELQRRGIPVSFFTSKRIQRRQLPLSPQTFLAGGTDAVQGALQQLKIPLPLLSDYPPSLAPFLHRRIWRTTLGQIEYEIVSSEQGPWFIKPADRRKSFTGHVFLSIDDFRLIGDVSRRHEVWCAAPVEWLSEFRVYVLGDTILSVDCYSGDANIPLDLETVRRAIAAFRLSGEAPAACALDFGVLSTGQTALVEVNDAYAIGAYKIGAESYTDLLFARWQELLSTPNPEC